MRKQGDNFIYSVNNLMLNKLNWLLTGTWNHDHMTPVLALLHWLPVCFRIDFKICLIFVGFQCFGATWVVWPSYSYSCQNTEVVQSHGPWCSQTKTSRNRGDCAFSVAAPKVDIFNWELLILQCSNVSSRVSQCLLIQAEFWDQVYSRFKCFVLCVLTCISKSM